MNPNQQDNQPNNEQPVISEQQSTQNMQQPDDYAEQPVAGEPTQAEQPAVSQATPVPTEGEDPGKVLGILGLVLGFFITPIVGIILSILSRKKSLRAGFTGTLGKIGIIVNTVLLVIGVLILSFLAFITFISYNGIQERAAEQEQRALEQQAEAKRKLELQQ